MAGLPSIDRRKRKFLDGLGVDLRRRPEQAGHLGHENRVVLVQEDLAEVEGKHRVPPPLCADEPRGRQGARRFRPTLRRRAHLRTVVIFEGSSARRPAAIRAPERLGDLEVVRHGAPFVHPEQERRLEVLSEPVEKVDRDENLASRTFLPAAHSRRSAARG